MLYWKKKKKIKKKHLQISLSKSSWYNLHDLQFLRYRANHTEISNFSSFFAPLPPIKPQNLNFEKWKNFLSISSFCTCVRNITITGCTVPEIRSEKDRIFCHFGPFLTLSVSWQPGKSKFWKLEKTSRDIIILHICTISDIVYHIVCKSNSIWFLRYGEQQTEFFVILDNFLPFYAPMDPEN